MHSVDDDVMLGVLRHNDVRMLLAMPSLSIYICMHIDVVFALFVTERRVLPGQRRCVRRCAPVHQCQLRYIELGHIVRIKDSMLRVISTIMGGD